MSVIIISAIAIALFFAMNMGASGISATMTSAYGGNLLSRNWAIILFALFVILGAVIGGAAVTKTISKGIVPAGAMTESIALIILFSATISMFIANMLKVPQSTSQVTVLAVTAFGLYAGNLNTSTLSTIMPVWFILPMIAIITAYALEKALYKRMKNWLARTKTGKRKKITRLFVIASACYVAFGIGTNNVANALGPLISANIIENYTGTVLLACFFGVGAFLIGRRVLENTSKKLHTMDMISATIVSISAGSFLLLASFFGIPTSLVQLQIGGVIGIAFAQNGTMRTVRQRTTKNLLKVWLASPLIAFLICLGLSFIML